MKLGKKSEIDIRRIWKHEANDFTTWLAENLGELSESLDLNLSLVEREKNIGDFKCDLFCKDDYTDTNVIIENQLEQSNHDHLGKIITYASGLKASIIIWIVKRARPEHISAIAWLNESTDENISFFLIELHAFVIDNSSPAAEFKIVEQPKEFNKSIKRLSNVTKSDLNWKQLEFWKRFNNALEKHKLIFKPRKASAQNWYDLPIGSSKYLLRVNIVNTNNRVDINFFTRDKNFYDKLGTVKDHINSVIPYKLIWDRLDSENKKSSKIYTSIYGLDLFDDLTYDNLINQIVDILICFNKEFKKYI